MSQVITSDPELFSLIKQEELRQQECLSLIASENIVSSSVKAAVGSCMTNKYAEGYPGRRYYGGCSIHDQVESIAISRAKEIFNADHANVQPHSGSNANQAAYFSLIGAGDTILAMDLDHGGHLTHGSKVNFSGKLFNIIHYGVTKDEHLIDYNSVRRLAQEHRPKLIIAGASAYSRIINFAKFHEIAKEVGAYLLVDMAHIAGLVAAKQHPSPVEYADIVTTTTHKTLRGPRGGMIMCKKDFAKKVDSWVFPGLQGGPLMHEIAGKAVCFKEVMDVSFVEYQKCVIKNAKRLALKLKEAGMKLVSNGTDNHLVLADLTPLNITGKEAETLLGEIGIVVNKNKIPFDDKPASVTSGIRLGTPAITTRGMKEAEMDRLAELIIDCIKKKSNIKAMSQEVDLLAKEFIL